METPVSVGEAETARLGALWKEIQNALQARIQREQFETWFRRAALTDATSESVRVTVHNGFARDWLRNNYGSELRQAVEEVCGGPRQVDIEADPEVLIATLGPPVPTQERESREAAPPTPPSAAPAKKRTNGTTRDPLHDDSDVSLNPKYRFDSFVVGPCNRFAHAAAMGVSEAPGQNYNPFFLHGSVGLGKTHLLQSLCHALLERDPGVRILYLSCETFVNHFISAIENGDTQEFRHKYRNVDVLVVDDIHVLANKERTQEEFFHTFNTLYNAGRQIVLSSDSPPKEIPTLQDRLVSRFKWGLVTEIEPPCYETRMAILKRKSREQGRELPDDVARLLAEHIDTNIRELEGATTRLQGFAKINGLKITCDLARKVLSDVFERRSGQPSMEDILRVVARRHNVKPSDLQSRRRTNAIAHPRQIAMYLARQITRHSLEEIGAFFGGRDHSTVLYAVGKVKARTQEDEEYHGQVSSLLRELQ